MAGGGRIREGAAEVGGSSLCICPPRQVFVPVCVRGGVCVGRGLRRAEVHTMVTQGDLCPLRRGGLECEHTQP